MENDFTQSIFNISLFAAPAPPPPPYLPCSIYLLAAWFFFSLLLLWHSSIFQCAFCNSALDSITFFPCAIPFCHIRAYRNGMANDAYIQCMCIVRWCSIYIHVKLAFYELHTFNICIWYSHRKWRQWQWQCIENEQQKQRILFWYSGWWLRRHGTNGPLK